MTNNKTSTLNVRIKPALKHALRDAAVSDHRSVSNLLEKMIIDYCKDNGIAIPEQEDFFGSELNEASDAKSNH
jgi:hypothetical protein